MNAYYFTVHFEKKFVTGFISMGDNPDSALKNLKNSLVKSLRAKSYLDTNGDKNRIKSFIYALKRPWRINTVEVYLITPEDPLYTGYWISYILPRDNRFNKHVCNSPSNIRHKF